MPGMPFHLEKGPLLSVLDDFCNGGSDERLLTALSGLRSGLPLTDIGLFDAPSLVGNVPPYETREQLIDHFNRHWLGITPLDNATAGTQTGHWRFYAGPVEDIMRETLIRALEVVLGVPHPAPGSRGANTAAPTRHWTIDFWWKCPQPWFEGWITWRQTAAGGQVTVIFATPSDDGVVLRRPAVEASPAPAQVTTETEGSWVISSEVHDQMVQVTVFPTSQGAVIFPTTWTNDPGPVVALAPNFGSGGAKDGGHPYDGTS